MIIVFVDRLGVSVDEGAGELQILKRGEVRRVIVDARLNAQDKNIAGAPTDADDLFERIKSPGRINSHGRSPRQSAGKR